ncbi:hypothetical protein [Streptomyces sp. MST-110588]|uniref:hypothetical protein n=1 Tax=Streptomyces sp. MST-110588 TaxID=2833628 RepID=UPI003242D96F
MDRATGPTPLSLVVAVGLLGVGAALGSWVALGTGWVLAYGSRRLSRAEAKFAAVGVPGLVAGGLLVWLGAAGGAMGEPVGEGRMGQELVDGLPVAVRVAAVASALFLVWRMRRRPR